MSLKFEILVSNNKVEYEAFTTDLTLAVEIVLEKIKLLTNSWFVVSQVKEHIQAKDPLLQQYVNLTRENLAKFESHEILHI